VKASPWVAWPVRRMERVFMGGCWDRVLVWIRWMRPSLG
jgi:hypothetical protein